jgi:hypothetical protein
VLTKDVAELKPLDQFIYWCVERNLIYKRKTAGAEPPWTDDEILQSYFFCNPYRENDKVTQWFRTNVRDPLKDKPEVVFATICFRWFNWIPTGEVLLGELHHPEQNLLIHWDLEDAVDRLETMKEAGEKVFTGAFNISNSGSTKPKINRVCEDYIQPAWETVVVDGPVGRMLNWFTDWARMGLTMESAHTMLMKLPGLKGSGFMAYEIVCDLRYTWVLRDAPDKLTWSNPGPGAKRGINRLLGRPLEAPVKDWPEQSQRLLKQVNERLPRSMPRFEMREIEHSLCELDKYLRALKGEGHMKRRYDGA